MRPKIKLLFVYRDGVADAAFDAALTRQTVRLQQHFEGRLEFCRAYRVRDEELKHVAAGAFDEGRPFDAMLEIVGDNIDFNKLVGLCEGLGQRLQTLIEPEASAALAGSEHIILPGDGPLLVLIANRRLPNYTHAGFLKYWIEYHGPFAREHTPPDAGLFYRQFHTDEDATRKLLHATGFGVSDFDGAAECYYASAESVRKLMGDTATVDQATVDEKKFVDHERCVTTVFTIAPDSTSQRVA
ncbi:MAG: hypothetical protein JWM78_1749 [Verrucomicrobiaceae bacterium]|nr:hypothetical protein [Verrucomicrobiaceae bacterium]